MQQGVEPSRITVHTNSPAKGQLVKKLGFKLHLVEDKLSLPDMKFDIVIGNPPYQGEGTRAMAGKALWHKFVHAAFNVCNPDGYVALVHPGQWRLNMPKYKDTKDLLISNNLVYLNMNSDQQGYDTFGAYTSFDYYVVQKAPYKGKTKLVSFSGKKSTLNLTGKDYIPHESFDFYDQLLAREGEEVVNVIYTNNYHHNKCSDSGKHKVAYRITQEGVRYKYTDDNSMEPFGVSKVIVCGGGGGNILEDPDGIYGTSQFCWSIALPKEDVAAAAKFMRSDKFRAAMKDSRLGIDLIEKGLCSALRKDFWKPRT